MKPPVHVAWSTDHVDLTDPFQRRWYLKQILLHGRTEDVRSLDLGELDRALDHLDLPVHLYALWTSVLRSNRSKG